MVDAPYLDLELLDESKAYYNEIQGSRRSRLLCTVSQNYIINTVTLKKIHSQLIIQDSAMIRRFLVYQAIYNMTYLYRLECFRQAFIISQATFASKRIHDHQSVTTRQFTEHSSRNIVEGKFEIKQFTGLTVFKVHISLYRYKIQYPFVKDIGHLMVLLLA